MVKAKAWMTHNPKCETSRNVLAILRDHGIEPEIREYLKAPLSKAEIAALIKEMKVSARELVRWSEPGKSGRSSGPSGPANAIAARAQARREAKATGAFRVADLVRWKETEAVDEAGISDKSSDAVLIRAMAEHPVLLNRPIVRTRKGISICRPSETVKELL